MATDIVERVELDTWGWGEVILKPHRKENPMSTWLEWLTTFATIIANNLKPTTSTSWIENIPFLSDWLNSFYNSEGKTYVYIHVGSQTFFEDKIKKAYKDLGTESKRFINITNKVIIISCTRWMNSFIFYFVWSITSLVICLLMHPRVNQKCLRK